MTVSASTIGREIARLPEAGRSKEVPRSLQTGRGSAGVWRWLASRFHARGLVFVDGRIGAALLPHLVKNLAESNGCHEHYDQRMRRLVENRFADDLSLFGYRFQPEFAESFEYAALSASLGHSGSPLKFRILSNR